MDPSKRVCIKNIPTECTKRELAEFVRNRTGAQPHSIDLGLDGEGRVRRYAHFSVEGAKNVVPSLSGATWRGVEILALHAKPHYMYRLAEAKRQRERQEAEEREQLEALWQQRTERWLAKTGGELHRGKTPKSFFATRQRYAEVAAAIAKRLREEHKGRQQQEQQRYHYHYHHHQQQQQQQEVEVVAAQRRVAVGDDASSLRPPSSVKAKKPHKHPRDRSDFVTGGDKKQRIESTPASSGQVQEKQPDKPSREERKLSGLQAKLAALHAKMK